MWGGELWRWGKGKCERGKDGERGGRVEYFHFHDWFFRNYMVFTLRVFTVHGQQHDITMKRLIISILPLI